MYFNPLYFQKRMVMNQENYVLDFKEGDVNGDGILDKVYLLGEKPFDSKSPFRENIKLKIIDGKTNREFIISFKEDAGYSPTLFLGDFSGDKVDDILISIASGGSGGFGFYYIYSFLYNIPKVMFDFEKFNEEYKCLVNYKDNYKVEVISKKTNKKYRIDIAYKGEKYLSEIYNKNGKLKEPIQGWVNPLGGLYPIDFQGNGIYELYALQRIAGRYNADGLGYVQTSLKWNESSFVDFFQTVGVFGEDINTEQNYNIRKFPEEENENNFDFSKVEYRNSEKIKDIKLEDAFAKIYGLQRGVDKVRYYYNKIDLDGDGILETLVYLVGISTCGTGGCSGVIFKDVDGEYELLSNFTLVNNPIIISENKTNGYKDLIMHVSGGGITSFFAELKYDGNKYPLNPSIQPELPHGTKVKGIAIISDDISISEGIEF